MAVLSSRANYRTRKQFRASWTEVQLCDAHEPQDVAACGSLGHTIYPACHEQMSTPCEKR